MASIKILTLLMVVFCIVYAHAASTNKSPPKTQQLDGKSKNQIAKTSKESKDPKNTAADNKDADSDDSDDYDFVYDIIYVDDDGNEVDFDGDNDNYYCENCDDLDGEGNTDDDYEWVWSEGGDGEDYEEEEGDDNKEDAKE